MIDKKTKGYILAAPYGDMKAVDNDRFDVVERMIQRLRAEVNRKRLAQSIFEN